MDEIIFEQSPTIMSRENGIRKEVLTMNSNPYYDQHSESEILDNIKTSCMYPQVSVTAILTNTYKIFTCGAAATSHMY